MGLIHHSTHPVSASAFAYNAKPRRFTGQQRTRAEHLSHEDRKRMLQLPACRYTGTNASPLTPVIQNDCPGTATGLHQV
jgi:hypothetical protein